MNRQKWAGLLFVGIVVLIIASILIVFGSARFRGLRYTVVFQEGKGIRVGNRVQMNGVDIGEVDSVKLDVTGKKVLVKIKIPAEHREKVLANSTAYIDDPTFVNVSGEKVVKVFNSANGGGLMPRNGIIHGKDSYIELKMWQAKEGISNWSNDVQKASKDLGEAAKQLTDGAKSAIESFARGVKEGITDGQNQTPLPGEPEKTPGKGPKLVEPGELQDTAKRLGDFMNELGTKGKEQFQELNKKWQALKADLMPLLQKLKDEGSELLHRKLQDVLDRIERALDQMRKEREGQPTPEGEPKAGEPVPI